MMAERLNDVQLLKRFEPILRFTKGELFKPMAVEPYIESCSLWLHRPNRPPECLVPSGELTVSNLITIAQPTDFESVYYLRFIDEHELEPLGVGLLRGSLTYGQGFRPGRGRLARVGYSARLIDALFAITLLARGRVPGDTAAGSYLAYKAIMDKEERYQYYGRVIHQDGWIVLQYWYFYAFNNWRSGFTGVNDHEGDWELVCLYLDRTAGGDVHPEWVAYSTHDVNGDDLRRRWDDPEVDKIGEHPVVYVGAGSHAGYFMAGEYMSDVVLPFLTPFVRLVDQQQRFWRRLLRQYQPEEFRVKEQPNFNLFRVPFIDYARGDGLSVGAGQEKTWAEPCLLDPLPGWALHYRGLWGLYTLDPISGEDAPAGPLYNRDGRVRLSWYDPVSWTGLSKVPPPSEMLARTQTRREVITVEQERLRQEVSAKQQELIGLSVEAGPMRGLPHLKEVYKAHQAQIETLSEELTSLRSQLTANNVLLETIDRHIPRIKAGERGALRGHITHGHQPVTMEELRLGRFLEFFSAVSIGLVMFAYVFLLFVAPQNVWQGMVILGLVLAFIEAWARHRVYSLVSALTNILTVVAALVLIYKFWFAILVGFVLLIGIYVTWQNVSEFRH